MDPKQIAQIMSSLETKEGEARILRAQIFEAAIADLELKHQQEIKAIEAKIAAEAEAAERAAKEEREAHSEERRIKEMETLSSLWRTGTEDTEISVERENQLADLLGVPRRRIVWEPANEALTQGH